MKVFFSVVVISIVLFGCKKNVDDPDLDDPLVKLYTNTANTADGLLSEVQLFNEDQRVFYYGSFNSEGNPGNIRSIGVSKANNDTICNFILDSFFRPQIIYYSLKNNNRINMVCKLQYPTNDSLIFSCYRYDFVTMNDSLLYQCRMKNINNVYSGITTYGRQIFNQSTALLSAEELRNKQLAYFINNRFSEVHTAIVNALWSPVLRTFGIRSMVTYTSGISIASTALVNAVSAGASIATPTAGNLYPASPTAGRIPNPIGTAVNPLGYLTVTDIEGNIYKTFRIGSQVWMAENLKTSRYNDGTPIIHSTTQSMQLTLSQNFSGAYNYYNNDTANRTIYGNLYNWYAVNSGKLAPQGWHVPTIAEWNTLLAFLGTTAGSDLKEAGTLHWTTNTNATNSSGFTALGGGYSHAAGSFYQAFRTNGFYWSSTTNVIYDRYAHNISLNTFNNNVFVSDLGDKGSRFSVRCIKN